MSEKPNTYDRRDMVRREACILAGPLRVAAYRVRDPETGEFSNLQFHSTYDNTVEAVMSENGAKLFAHFVNKTLGIPQYISQFSDDEITQEYLRRAQKTKEPT